MLFVKRHMNTSVGDTAKFIVFGGSGYVGQRIVKHLILSGQNVVSISRSGEPSNFKAPSNGLGSITWHRADIFEKEEWADQLKDSSGVVSCIGAFGSNEFMEKVNGDANILAIEESVKAGVPRFVFVSTGENNLPDFVLKGYFNGKRRAEKALKEAYANFNPTSNSIDDDDQKTLPVTGGFVLRPGFMYGARQVPLKVPGPLASLPGLSPDGICLPLQLVGKPLSLVLGNPVAQGLRNSLPGMKAVLAKPLPVETVGRAAADLVMGRVAKGDIPADGVVSIPDIEKIAGL